MIKRLIGNKKGVSMAMITETMVILFSIFALMSTFIVLDSVMNKNKRNIQNGKIYFEQISQEFIHYNTVKANNYATNDEYLSNPSKMLEDAKNEFRNNYDELGPNYQVVSDKVEGSKMECVMQNITPSQKYKLTIVVDTDNMTTKLMLQRTYSDTIYFTCELRFEKVADTTEYNVKIINWNYKI